MDLLVERVAWNRRGVANDFVGSLRAGCDGIRLDGRDPRTGVDVTLSIPSDEVEHVYASPTSSEQVIVELANAEPIVLRRIQAGPLQGRLLARRLRGLLLLPRLHVPGG